MEKSSTNNNVSWFSNHWVMILTAIIGGIFIIGILKILSQLFSSNGPISQGLGDFFGAVANLLDGITNGCTPQDTCDASDDTSCSSQKGCDWKPSPTSGQQQKGTCISSTGKNQTSGSFFSTSCFLGMGAIAALCGEFIFLVLGPLIKRFATKSNPTLDVASQTSGKTYDECLVEAHKTARETAETAQKSIESEQKRTLSDTEKRALGKASGAVETRKLAERSINGQSNLSAADKASKLQNVQDLFNSQRDSDLKDLKNAGVSDENAKDLYEYAEKVNK